MYIYRHVLQQWYLFLLRLLIIYYVFYLFVSVFIETINEKQIRHFYLNTSDPKFSPGYFYLGET